MRVESRPLNVILLLLMNLSKHPKALVTHRPLKISLCLAVHWKGSVAQFRWRSVLIISYWLFSLLSIVSSLESINSGQLPYVNYSFICTSLKLEAYWLIIWLIIRFNEHFLVESGRRCLGPVVGGVLAWFHTMGGRNKWLRRRNCSAYDANWSLRTDCPRSIRVLVPWRRNPHSLGSSGEVMRRSVRLLLVLARDPGFRVSIAWRPKNPISSHAS